MVPTCSRSAMAKSYAGANDHFRPGAALKTSKGCYEQQAWRSASGVIIGRIQ